MPEAQRFSRDRKMRLLLSAFRVSAPKQQMLAGPGSGNDVFRP